MAIRSHVDQGTFILPKMSELYFSINFFFYSEHLRLVSQTQVKPSFRIKLKFQY